MKQIDITESKITEALAQIDALEGLNNKDKGCLRLLTEEMFSMVKELLKVDTLDFEMRCEGGQYSLCVATETQVDEDAREQFLSMSSSGKNTANKGVKGLLGSVLEMFSYSEILAAHGMMLPYGMNATSGEYACIWTLSQYMDSAPQDKLNEDWDGMEKSIIANFADDVSIGVRRGKLEMTVTKTF